MVVSGFLEGLVDATWLGPAGTAVIGLTESL
jgi:hypothetical protein